MDARSVSTPRWRRRRVLPGFGLTLGYTLTWLALIVLIPLAGVFLKAAELGWSGLWAVWTDPRVLSALKLSFGTALAAAAFNAVMGTLVAWVLVRYRFPGRRLLDAMIDLPFALPTAVAGIALTALYSGNGWIGRWLEPYGIKVAYAPLGIVVALVLVYSRFGMYLRAVGLNALAARRAGMPITSTIVGALALAGALGGLAGALMLQGDQYSLKAGFSSGYGFDGLVVGLLARGSITGVCAAALLFGFLRSGGINMEMVASVPSALVLVVQGVVIVALAGGSLWLEPQGARR